MMQVFQYKKGKLWFTSAIKNPDVVTELLQEIKLSLVASQARITEWVLMLLPVVVQYTPLFKSACALFLIWEFPALASQ